MPLLPWEVELWTFSPTTVHNGILVAVQHDTLVCLPTFTAVRRIAFALVWLSQSETIIPWILEAGVAARKVVLLSSPLIPGELAEVRGASRERDKKRVILAWTGAPDGFTAWLHKHLCQHKAGRAHRGWNKWSAEGKMRMLLLLTPQE